MVNLGVWLDVENVLGEVTQRKGFAAGRQLCMLVTRHPDRGDPSGRAVTSGRDVLGDQRLQTVGALLELLLDVELEKELA